MRVSVKPSLLQHSFSLGPARLITQPSAALIRTLDLRDTGVMLYQLSCEATHWEQGHLCGFYLFHEEIDDDDNKKKLIARRREIRNDTILNVRNWEKEALKNSAPQHEI